MNLFIKLNPNRRLKVEQLIDLHSDLMIDDNKITFNKPINMPIILEIVLI